MTKFRRVPTRCLRWSILPGQFDQRAEACAQCIALLSQTGVPVVRTARVYLLSGAISVEQLSAIKRYIINPVEAQSFA